MLDGIQIIQRVAGRGALRGDRLLKLRPAHRAPTGRLLLKDGRAVFVARSHSGSTSTSPVPSGEGPRQAVQDERERIVKRAQDGRKAAKARGVQFGRKPKLTQHQQAEGRRLETGESARSIARDFNCHHAIVARLRLS